MSKKSLWKRWETPTTVIFSLLAILGYLLDLPEKVAGLAQRWSDPKSAMSSPRTEPPSPQSVGTLSSPEVKATAPLLPQRTSSTHQTYINPGHLNQPTGKQVAIVVAGESDCLSDNIEDALTAVLTNRGVEPVRSLFRPAFVSEGRAQLLFDGEMTIVKDLELARYVDYVVIALCRVSYDTSSGFEGLLTANLQLQLRCVDVVSAHACGSRAFSTPGAGHSRVRALQTAVEHSKSELEQFLLGIRP